MLLAPLLSLISLAPVQELDPAGRVISSEEWTATANKDDFTDEVVYIAWVADEAEKATVGVSCAKHTTMVIAFDEEWLPESGETLDTAEVARVRWWFDKHTVPNANSEARWKALRDSVTPLFPRAGHKPNHMALTGRPDWRRDSDGRSNKLEEPRGSYQPIHAQRLEASAPPRSG